jgi:hypothetical protein
MIPLSSSPAAGGYAPRARPILPIRANEAQPPHTHAHMAYPHTYAVSSLLTLLGAVWTTATGGGSHGSHWRRSWTREAVTSRERGGVGHAELPF